jgi:hypothetical protein
MRTIFGILGLLVVVAIVGMLAKKQLASGVAPAAAPVPGTAATVPAGTPKQQVEQFQKAVEGAMQPPAAPERDENK